MEEFEGIMEDIMKEIMEAQRKSEEIMEEPNHKRFRKGWRFECSGDVGGRSGWQRNFLPRHGVIAPFGWRKVLAPLDVRIRIIQLKIGCSVPVSSG